MASILSVHETVLYGDDVPALASFYERVVGLRVVSVADETSAGLRLPSGDAVLLLFSPAHAEKTGRGVPTHGARGPGHVALRVAPGGIDAWRTRLLELGVAIEMERGWNRGGRSIYVRDPAGNSVEFVEGEIWAG